VWMPFGRDLQTTPTACRMLPCGDFYRAIKNSNFLFKNALEVLVCPGHKTVGYLCIEKHANTIYLQHMRNVKDIQTYIFFRLVGGTTPDIEGSCQ
jgi:hypothetical protein